MYISFFKKSIHVSVDGWVDLPLRYTVLKILFIYFLERGREGERGEKHNVWLPLVCTLLGTWLATQACALTRNRTIDPVVHKLVLNPLSHTSQGWNKFFALLPVIRVSFPFLSPFLQPSSPVCLKKVLKNKRPLLMLSTFTENTFKWKDKEKALLIQLFIFWSVCLKYFPVPRYIYTSNCFLIHAHCGHILFLKFI